MQPIEGLSIQDAYVECEDQELQERKQEVMRKIRHIKQGYVDAVKDERRLEKDLSKIRKRKDRAEKKLQLIASGDWSALEEGQKDQSDGVNE